MKKVFVLGIDGMPYDFLINIVRRGELPTFKKLIENGSHGILRSTIPAISPVSWTSLATGKNPGKHGMFGFGRLIEDILVPYYSMNEESSTVWNMLSATDKKVIIINFPWTYPPHKVNGIMISGFPSPMNKAESFPPEILSELKSKIGKYYVDISYLMENYEGLDENRFLDEIYTITKQRAKAMLYLAERYRWDFCITVFTSLDRIQHVFYGYCEKDSVFYDARRERVLIEYYKELDHILDELLLLLLNEDVVLMIVSDHGFEPLRKYVGVNNLLAAGCFLKRSRARLFNRESIYERITSSILLKKMFSALPTELIQFIQYIIPSRLEYSQSIAFSGNSPVTISLRRGINPNLKEKIRKKIIDYFYSVKDPEDNQLIVEKIYTKEDIISGNHLEEAPDIYLIFKKGYEPQRWSKKTIQRIDLPSRHSTIITGTHGASYYSRRGTLIIYGRDIKRNYIIDSSVFDITPTILHVLNVHIPADVDGRVLKEVFLEDSEIARRGIKFKEKKCVHDVERPKRSLILEEEIRKRLSNLGYL